MNVLDQDRFESLYFVACYTCESPAHAAVLVTHTAEWGEKVTEWCGICAECYAEAEAKAEAEAFEASFSPRSCDCKGYSYHPCQ